ncbi:hypothetical protein Ancab_036402 [Ancistrocladus abbreviatus]
MEDRAKRTCCSKGVKVLKMMAEADFWARLMRDWMKLSMMSSGFCCADEGWERRQTHFDKAAILRASHQTTRASCPQKSSRDAQLFRRLKREGHDGVRNYAGHRWDAGTVSVVELSEKLPERSDAKPVRGVTQRRDILGGVYGVGWWEAIRDGFELERREAVERMGASRSKEAPVVEFSVDEGDMEGSGMKEFSQLEHGVNVALCWRVSLRVADGKDSFGTIYRWAALIV